MKTLELIRRLYDENADPADLEQDLDEEGRSELREILEAKNALEALPPRSPSVDSLAAVAQTLRSADEKNQAPKRRGLALILHPSLMHRYAAAAAVVVAVGIGYLTLRSPETQIDVIQTQLAKKTDADQILGESIAGEAVSSDKPSPATMEEKEGVAEKDELAAASIASEESFDDSVGSVGRTRMDQDHSALVAAPIDGLVESDLWDDESDFQTFYWQVQALGERSPNEEWEEAVPLEGSFEILNRANQDPALHKANSEK
jgi:hypothetical protein